MLVKYLGPVNERVKSEGACKMLRSASGYPEMDKYDKEGGSAGKGSNPVQSSASAISKDSKCTKSDIPNVEKMVESKILSFLQDGGNNNASKVPRSGWLYARDARFFMPVAFRIGPTLARKKTSDKLVEPSIAARGVNAPRSCFTSKVSTLVSFNTCPSKFAHHWLPSTMVL